MAGVHQRVAAAARRWRVPQRWAVLAGRGASLTGGALVGLLALQLALLGTALVALDLDHEPATLACGGVACEPLPAASSSPAPTGPPPDEETTTEPRAPQPAQARAEREAPPASSVPAPAPADPTPDPDARPAVVQAPEETTASTDAGDAETQPFAAEEAAEAFARSRAQRSPPARRMPHAVYARHAAELIRAVPSLEVLQRELPPSAMTRDVARQLEHVAWLDAGVEATVGGYGAFTVDTSRSDAFADLPDYHDRIRPRMFLVHWTGIGYADVDHFVASLRPYRVQYFLDRDARAFQLFEADHHKPAHALGANDLSQGVEIETGTFDGTESPLFRYTPAQIEHTVYLAVDFLRRNGLPVDETTLLGHYAADLVFSNPHYEPHTGTLTEPRVRKFDPPQELMQVIVDKARTLDAALGPR